MTNTGARLIAASILVLAGAIASGLSAIAKNADLLTIFGIVIALGGLLWVLWLAVGRD